MAEIRQGAWNIPGILVHSEWHDSMANLLPICRLHIRAVNYIRSTWTGVPNKVTSEWMPYVLSSGESKPLDPP